MTTSQPQNTGVHTDATHARQGMTTGHMRWVLRISMALAVVALAGSWAWFSSHSHVTDGGNGPAARAQAH